MVTNTYNQWKPILERWEQLDAVFGAEISIVRDDLLPFPMAGNKVRKVDAELSELSQDIDVVISNGGVNSNYCRTLAMFAAQKNIHAHFALHGKAGERDRLALNFLSSLGASYDIGTADTISDRISQARMSYKMKGMTVAVLSGGGHSAAGARAFAEAGQAIFRDHHFDQVFVASGTGATQGGLVAAADLYSPTTQILGISVAREKEQGRGPVLEAARWAGSENPEIYFLDGYRDGGYDQFTDRTVEAMGIAWKKGLPIDPTYSGKAFNAMLDFSRKEKLGSSVLFWHTGGLMNWFSHSMM